MGRIDDQLRIEEALRNSTRQLQQMIDAVPVNILSFGPSGKITSASKRYLEQVGAPPEHIEDFEALARHLAHPEDLPRGRAWHGRARRRALPSSLLPSRTR
ncbi:hypothetical protein [Inquilinus limosus]|uniref:hypothetical protein n=1 Tax=Inquilinus limosus TaxID=171674 RepID=UPI000407E097|nr:hypothetical protein [Inquilinus limosus]